MSQKSKNPRNSYDDKFNIIFVGDENVGKTSIINRYINNKFLDEKIEEYKLETDTVRSFLDEHPLIENRQTKDVHKEYCLYCCDIGKMSLGLSNFSSRLKSNL